MSIKNLWSKKTWNSIRQAAFQEAKRRGDFILATGGINSTI